MAGIVARAGLTAQARTDRGTAVTDRGTAG
jgi:hypothetical protein